MKNEMWWLAMTAAMTALFWLPYILNRAMRAGFPGAFLTPPMNAPPVEAEWALRAKRAHANAVENLVTFAPLVLVAHAIGVSNETTIFCAALYFWTRLAHYLALTLGVPYLRTLVWAGSWAAQMGVAWQIVSR